VHRSGVCLRPQQRVADLRARERGLHSCVLVLVAQNSERRGPRVETLGLNPVLRTYALTRGNVTSNEEKLCVPAVMQIARAH
jgi:hypothetical protein